MIRRTPTRMLAAAAALALSAAACGSSADDASVAPATTETSTAATEPAGPGPLDLQAMTASGESIDLADYAGQDVVLWFWAPW